MRSGNRPLGPERRGTGSSHYAVDCAEMLNEISYRRNREMLSTRSCIVIRVQFIENFYPRYKRPLGFPTDVPCGILRVLSQTNSLKEFSNQGRRDLEESPAWRVVEQEFLRTGRAADAQTALTGIFERTVIAASQASLDSGSEKALVVVAAGDFASGEMFPYSTADVLIVASRDARLSSDESDEFLGLLWAGGMRPALRIYTAEEYGALPTRNPDLAMKLLDRKVLAGNSDFARKVAGELEAAIASQRPNLVDRLVSQARARHARFRNTPSHMEPDVWESPGGLRDVRAIRNIQQLSQKSAAPRESLDEAVQFLSRVCIFLEYRARKEERLFDRGTQEAMAAQFGNGKTVSAWMREYFRHARTIFDLARYALDISVAGTEEQGPESIPSHPEFEVLGGRVRIRDPKTVQSNPVILLRLLEFVAQRGTALSPDAEEVLQAARPTLDAFYGERRPLWPVLRTIFDLPYAPLALRILQMCGLMTAFFPEWALVEGEPAADVGQPFTVDEQALLTAEQIGELRTSREPAVARFSQLFSEIEHPGVVLLAALFSGLKSAPADASAANDLLHQAAARMQLSQAEHDVLLFLVDEQTALTGMVNRDVNDTAAVRRMADRAGTIERLKMLTILSYGQIAQGGGEDGTSYRLDQVWRAHSAVSRELTRELETDRIQDVPPELRHHATFIQGFPVRYLRAHPAEEITAHIRLYDRSRGNGVAVQLDTLPGAFQLTVIANDRPGLFGSLAGAISSFGMNIMKAEAFSNSEGVILDTFVFTDPKRALELNPPEAERLQDLMTRIALGKTEARRLFRNRPGPRLEPPALQPEIQFDSEACESATLVEVMAEDRPGLLYALATVFFSSSCNIDAVLIDTKGNRALDVFYVARGGAKLSPELQHELREKLTAACLGVNEATQA